MPLAMDRLAGRALGALALLLATLLLNGCIRFNYFRISRFEPVAEPGLKTLIEKLPQPDPAAGTTPGKGPELQECLDVLGAPYLVGEANNRVVLAYAWVDRTFWRFNVSYTFERFINLQFDYASTSDDLNGVVLVFGDDLRLRTIKRGGLRRIAEQINARRRPRPVEDDEGDGDRDRDRDRKDGG